MNEKEIIRFAKAKRGYEKICMKFGFYIPMYLLLYRIRRRRYRILFDAFFTDITNFKPLRILLAKSISALGIKIIEKKELDLPLIKPLATPQKILSDIQELLDEVGVSYFEKDEAIQHIQEGLREFIPVFIDVIERSMDGEKVPIRHVFLGLLMKEGLGITYVTFGNLELEKAYLVYYPIIVDENNIAYEVAWRLTPSEIYTMIFSSRKILNKIMELS